MEKYFDEIVNSTVEILKFDSSLQEATEGYPFGKGAGDCLAYFLSLAEGMGFATRNYDNYVGEVVFGEGKEFAILAHLDVVPAGSGWKYPPFEGVINDDISDGGVTGMKIWGRGAMDDKAPAIVCLYALKKLKESGLSVKRKFKLIVGCNEEAGWKCIEHYNEVAQMPEEGFTPDADFPVIYAEKGILHFTAKFPIQDSPIASLKAGERVNMVCDFAEAKLTKKAMRNWAGYRNPITNTRTAYDEKKGILRGYGKSAHGSTPDKGANALQAVLRYFAKVNSDIKRAYSLLFDDASRIKELEDETGKLTLSPDVASFDKGVLSVTSDIRFPATLPLEQVTGKLDEWGVEYVVENYQAPLFNDPEGKLISTLMGVYNEVTGKNERPIAIGGGTYARALRCGCAFGPEIQGEEATIHQANEYVTFDRLRLMSTVYYRAIEAIALEGAELPETQTEPAEEGVAEELAATEEKKTDEGTPLKKAEIEGATRIATITVRYREKALPKENADATEAP